MCIVEAIWRLKINDNQEGGGVAQSNLLPDRPGEPDCIYYLRTGLCGYGNNCRYNHPAHASQVTIINLVKKKKKNFRFNCDCSSNSDLA